MVFLHTAATTMPLTPPSEQDRLGTTAIRKVTAIEQVSPAIDASSITRVYVAGRVDESLA